MPTREGATLILLAGAIFLLATNLMSGLLFVLDALLISLLCAGAATSFWPLRGVQITRSAPLRAVEGDAVPLALTVTSRAVARFVEVADGWPGAAAGVLIPEVGPGAAVTAQVAPRAPRRGVFPLGPVRLESRGLVGLFLARRRLHVPGRILIWPRTRQVPAQALTRLASVLESLASDRTRDPEELYGVRDYRMGDSLAHVHWRSSARRGALVVREFERPRAVAATLVLDLDRRQAPERLDAAVRATASLLRLARDRQIDVAVTGWEEGLVALRGWEPAMDWLAHVTPSGPPVAEILPSLAAAGRRLIVVASSHDPALPADVTPVVPAEDLAASGQSYSGLVYTDDGMVQAW
jgi:uncharacterized protein (DUF58 family)